MRKSKGAITPSQPEDIDWMWIFPEVADIALLQSKLSEYGIVTKNKSHLSILELYYKYLIPLPQRVPNHGSRLGRLTMKKIERIEKRKPQDRKRKGIDSSVNVALLAQKRARVPQPLTSEMDKLEARSKAAQAKQKANTEPIRTAKNSNNLKCNGIVKTQKRVSSRSDNNTTTQMNEKGRNNETVEDKHSDSKNMKLDCTNISKIGVETKKLANIQTTSTSSANFSGSSPGVVKTEQRAGRRRIKINRNNFVQQRNTSES